MLLRRFTDLESRFGGGELRPRFHQSNARFLKPTDVFFRTVAHPKQEPSAKASERSHRFLGESFRNRPRTTSFLNDLALLINRIMGRWQERHRRSPITE